MNKSLLLLAVCLFTFQGISTAKTIRAGNMRVEQLSANTVRVTVNFFTNIHANAPQFELCWGDGSCEDWSSSKVAEWPEIDTRHFQMQTFHEYQNKGMVDINVVACCWAGDLINLSSGLTNPFKLNTSFLLGDEQDQFLNTTPEVTVPSSICSTDICLHSPQATDAEGDSLFWSLCVPELGVYQKLDEFISTGPAIQVSFNNNGSLVWSNPPFEGLFSHVSCLIEKRDGIVISKSQYFTLLVVNNRLPLEEPSALAKFVLSPNPVSDFLQLQNIPSEWQNSRTQIFNYLGEKVYEQRGIESIDLSQWTAGFYVLMLEKDGQGAVRRFVKN